MNTGKTPNKLSKYSFVFFVALAVIVFAFAVKQNPSLTMKEEKKISYSEFQTYAAEKGKIKEIVYINQQDKVRGATADGKRFIVNVPKQSDSLDRVLTGLTKQGVKVEIENPGFKDSLGSLLSMIILPLGLFALLWFLIIRQANVGGGQAMSFGRSRAKMLVDNLPRVTFEDVAGVDEAKEELVEIIEFLKEPKRFQTFGAKIPKGVLLVGPPGSGKTLLARAVAGEAKVPFFHMSGSDFVEMFVGVGASRVRDLFDQAKKNSPCLVFIDEMDAVGRQRGAGLGGGHDEREQTLNQLLVEMDGFDPNAGVIVLAATNRPDVLDPALLRPGRFDRRVVVDRPDVKGRLAILEVHSRGKRISHSVNLEVVARRTPGFTGADLSNVMNEAAILAARRGEPEITMDHVEEAIERNIAGPERKSRLLSDPVRKVTAYHEAGHALIAKLTPDADPVHKISILPRGMALGYTLQLPVEDKYMVSRKELMNEIRVLLGGRVAETLIFGQENITTGASNDLERVKGIARRMVCEYGMSENLGPLTFGHKHEAVFLGRDLAEERDYSEEVAALIDTEIKDIVETCLRETEQMLRDNMPTLTLVADKLLEKETLDGVLLERLLKGEDLPDDRIAELEAQRKKMDEEANSERFQRIEEAAKKNGGDGNGNGGEPVIPPPVIAEKEEEPALAGAGNGLVSRFSDSLNDILENMYRPKMKDRITQSAFTSADELFFSRRDYSGALQYINLSISECRDNEVLPGLRIMLGLSYLRLGQAERVADELMAALMTDPDHLEQPVERALVKSISYFRIVAEELKKNNLTFQKLLTDRSAIEKVDSRYMEWEQRTGLVSGPQTPAN